MPPAFVTIGYALDSAYEATSSFHFIYLIEKYLKRTRHKKVFSVYKYNLYILIRSWQLMNTYILTMVGAVNSGFWEQRRTQPGGHSSKNGFQCAKLYHFLILNACFL